MVFLPHNFLLDYHQNLYKYRYLQVSYLLNKLNENDYPDENDLENYKRKLNLLSKSLKVDYINNKIKCYFKKNKIPFHYEPDNLIINVEQPLEIQNDQTREWRNNFIESINYFLITDEQPSVELITEFIDQNILKLIED